MYISGGLLICVLSSNRQKYQKQSLRHLMLAMQASMVTVGVIHLVILCFGEGFLSQYPRGQFLLGKHRIFSYAFILSLGVSLATLFCTVLCFSYLSYQLVKKTRDLRHVMDASPQSPYEWVFSSKSETSDRTEDDECDSERSTNTHFSLSDESMNWLKTLENRKSSVSTFGKPIYKPLYTTSFKISKFNTIESRVQTTPSRIGVQSHLHTDIVNGRNNSENVQTDNDGKLFQPSPFVSNENYCQSTFKWSAVEQPNLSREILSYLNEGKSTTTNVIEKCLSTKKPSPNKIHSELYSLTEKGSTCPVYDSAETCHVISDAHLQGNEGCGSERQGELEALDCSYDTEDNWSESHEDHELNDSRWLTVSSSYSLAPEGRRVVFSRRQASRRLSNSRRSHNRCFIELHDEDSLVKLSALELVARHYRISSILRDSRRINGELEVLKRRDLGYIKGRGTCRGDLYL
ncbi:uncharacterized protein LOC143247735 isoform X2 [Tachypleus tridentatus]|uniref:uncharacterized protein LOC143247735 isoform X2 n=1 Tax=Tachypleus tridentatus TaxID=6853 RepID=UPI003FD634FB